MKLRSFIFGLFAAAAIVGCEEEIQITPEITLDKEAIEVVAAGGTYEVNVTANVAWTASIEAEGFSVDPASGNASGEAVKVTVTVAENTAEEARTATLQIKATDYEVTKTVTLTQAAKTVEPEDPQPEDPKPVEEQELTYQNVEGVIDVEEIVVAPDSDYVIGTVDYTTLVDENGKKIWEVLEYESWAAMAEALGTLDETKKFDRELQYFGVAYSDTGDMTRVKTHNTNGWGIWTDGDGNADAWGTETVKCYTEAGADESGFMSNSVAVGIMPGNIEDGDVYNFGMMFQRIKEDGTELNVLIDFIIYVEEPGSVLEAGNYWIMAERDGETKVMRPLADDKNYGYPASEDAVDGKSYAKNVFTFTEVAGGYTIQDASGRYYYQEENTEYKTFNASAELPENGGVWIIYITEDGEAVITSAASTKVVKYGDGTYTSFGVYAEGETENGVLPKLVKADEPLAEPEPDQITFTGDGLSAETAYTIDDLVKYYNAEMDKTTKVWVKGTIIGYMDNGNVIKETGENASATNLVIGNDEVTIPVQLPKGDVRDGLNLQANDHIGKEVALHGTIEAYFSMAGLKNVDDYVLAAAGDDSGDDEPSEELDSEKVIWTGTHNTASWAGMSELTYGGYDWSTVKAGQKLRILCTPNDASSNWWCISLRTGAEGWPDIKGAKAQYDKPSYAVTIDLTQETIDDLVANNGLVITGSETTITQVSILPADAEVSIWEGEIASTGYSNCTIGQVNDWMNNGLKAGDKFRVYVTVGDNWSFQMFDGQWKKWYGTATDGTQDGLYGHGFNASNTDLTSGYVEFTMTEEMYTTISAYTWGNILVLQGDAVTFTKITIL